MNTNCCGCYVPAWNRGRERCGRRLAVHGGASLLALWGAAIAASPSARVAAAQDFDFLPVPGQVAFEDDPRINSTGGFSSPAPGADASTAPSDAPPFADPATQADSVASSWTWSGGAPAPATDCWAWHAVPDGVIYPSYLAGVKEPRMATACNYLKGVGWTWDSALGARMGLLSYGTEGTPRPDGCELGVEGAAFPRLDLENDRILESVDFRFGVPLTFGFGAYQAKVAYYHSCSHLGDQYMLLFPDLVRTNYTRDAIVWGNSYYLIDDLRLYAEMSWGFHTWGAAKPWEFEFGAEYSPAGGAGSFWGSPFAAINEDLRQDVGYSGNFTAQAGWQWRGRTTRLFRIGIQYFTGKSEQFQFVNRYEESVGVGVWYDF